MVLPIIGGLHIEVKILTHWMEKVKSSLIKVFRFLTFILICSLQINPECICLCDLAKSVYIICIIGKAYTIRFLGAKSLPRKYIIVIYYLKIK